MTLPPIREWWSELSDDGRRSVLDAGSARLQEDVREEIRAITGTSRGMIESLSEDDLEYARAHPDGET